KHIWGVPYYVKVDGRLVPPASLPRIDWSAFSSSLSLNNTHGQHYQILTGVTTVDTTTLLSVHLEHKVSTSHYHELELVLENAWKRQHHEFQSSDIEIHIRNQEELVNYYGESTWRLVYSVSVNGTSMDKDTVKDLDLDTLQQEITSSGKLHVKLTRWANSQNLYETRNLQSVVVDKYIAIGDIDNFERAVVFQINRTLNESFTVHVVRQKEYVNTTGQSAWSVQFMLFLNGTTFVRKDMMAMISKELLSNATTMVTGIDNQRYSVVEDAADYVDIDNEYTLVLDKKVTETDKDEFRKHLEAAWKKLHSDWSAINVRIA
ncbi:hypothetical protein MAR_037153, partial [Mya arenaria]